MQDVIERIRACHERYLEEMIELVSIPSISPGRPDPAAIAAAAGWLERRLRQIGLDEVRQLEVPGQNPVVWGRTRVSDELPTVMFYGHYDVMPAEPLELWDSPPFAPEVRGGELFGRGTADDKGQVLMHLAALEAYLEVRGRLPVNVVVVIEGEEEEGSEALGRLLETDAELLAADVAVISDSPFFARGYPSVCYGLRGIAVAEILVDGPCRDLHSGNFGGAVANPAEALVRILEDLKGRDGRIAIDGFYDDVRELSQTEREAFAALPFSDDELCSDLGVPALVGEQGFTTLERIWARPTFEINGIGGGFQGDGSKTIVPSTARAKVSMRLVPDQRPEAVLQALRHQVEQIAPPGVRVRVELGHAGAPFLAPLDDPRLEAALAAVRKGFGQQVHLIRDGASIPIVNQLADTLGATCLLLGVDVPDGCIHGPNERIVLDNFFKGIEMIAYLLDELAP